ncbi:hypothetical protein [Bacteroides sp.]|uniref:hypothetical protein n=1 Tax=Bacteroides sp. TaxID=29523 RepID=UPI00260D0D1D|nr:hypothetical protein [Bacteroides sp.]MDD3039672.1 hypothetical protein [Bacteroides sp.]
MSPNEVIAILGIPKLRNFNDKGKSLEFYYHKVWAVPKIVKVWFVNDKVVNMSSRYDTDDDNCIKKIKTTEDKKEDTSSGIRITTDGHQLIKQGSLITTPEGTIEMVVSDNGGLIITASGKHIHTH